MRTSNRGIDFIKAYERLRLRAYNDQGGKPTIGYGHLIRPGEQYPGGIDVLKAENLLKSDLTEAERAVDRHVRVLLAQNEFDALVSFAFNVGIGNFSQKTGFAGSGMLRELNKGNKTGAIDRLVLWNRVGGKISRGLVYRRAAEREIFLRGDYSKGNK